MKHGLKKKYRWKRRKIHFADLKMQKLWTKLLVDNISNSCIMTKDFYSGNADKQWPNETIKDIRHEPLENDHSGGESALDGKKGTTIPFNKIHIFDNCEENIKSLKIYKSTEGIVRKLK